MEPGRWPHCRPASPTKSETVLANPGTSYVHAENARISLRLLEGESHVLRGREANRYLSNSRPLETGALQTWRLLHADCFPSAENRLFFSYDVDSDGAAAAMPGLVEDTYFWFLTQNDYRHSRESRAGRWGSPRSSTRKSMRAMARAHPQQTPPRCGKRECEIAVGHSR